jgi:DNA-binding cell septation regulator SpoVG
MSAPIEVLAIRKLDGTTTVKAFVDVRVGALVLKGGKVVCQPGQRAWYATPGVKTDHGWQQVVEITSKELRQRITDAVLEAWERRGEEPPARQAERGRATAEALEETGAAWSQKQRDEHIQELARRFDEREPDEIPF